MNKLIVSRWEVVARVSKKGEVFKNKLPVIETVTEM